MSQLKQIFFRQLNLPLLLFHKRVLKEQLNLASYYYVKIVTIITSSEDDLIFFKIAHFDLSCYPH